ncbi:MAG: helix-turn-helix domain-containing protein [Bacteroidota bacterium]|nr:helix-turn-helix domain-containing protein [Bacteroidota bacterium]
MEILLYIGIVQSLFASLLMFTKKNRQIYDVVLAIWLLLIALQLLSSLFNLKFEKFAFSGLIMLKLIPFTFGPFVYIYAKMLILAKPIFRVRYFFHFLPFILAVLLFLIFASKEVILAEVKTSFLGFESSLYHYIYSLLIIGSIMFYVVQVLYLIRVHEKNVYDYYSNESHKTNLRWLNTTSMIFAMAYLLAVTSHLFNFFLNLKNPVFQPDIFPIIGLTLFAYTISFFGFNQEAIFMSQSFIRLQRRKDRLADAGNDEIKTHIRYERSGLKDDEAQTYIENIKAFMENEKPYLNGSFNIEIMSHRLNIPKHFITQVLNELMKKNFYTFVNEYRIEEVKRRMADKKNENLTLLALAYDSGFNSKSSFNTIFKKLIGKTPSEYKNQIGEERK